MTQTQTEDLLAAAREWRAALIPRTSTATFGPTKTLLEAIAQFDIGSREPDKPGERDASRESGPAPVFNPRDLVVLEQLLTRWPSLSGAYGPDVMEMLTKVRRALAALDEGRTDV